jgi:hypothetical protein
MYNDIQITPETLPNQLFTIRQERQQLLKAFWLAVTVLFLVELATVKTSSMASIFGASLIAFFALLPIYLWCSGKALGMPIFPLFALTYLWTHALPLVSEHPRVLKYSPEEHLFASITVAGFLGLGTFIWFQFVKNPSVIPSSYRVLKSQNSEGFFLFILASGIFFNMYSLAGWFALEGGSFALIRGAILGLNVLAVFVLSYRCGARELLATKSTVFLFLLALYIITSAASLLLISALSIVFLATVAFVLGRGKVPWIPIIIVLICLSFLHYGKGDMRAKYWADNQAHFVQPWEYPAWFGEWIDYSFQNVNNKDSHHLNKSEEKASFTQRSSVIQMLLLAQAATPRYVPYLSGETYAIIPQLLVPRILNTNKVRSHEGTYLLSIHYGLQNRHATLNTTIAWGLLSEAYANFGISGCAGLGIILGAFYGQATRWSLNTPLLSSRSLFGVLLISFAFQSEWTAGVYVAALFQSLVPLGVINFVFMKSYTNREPLFISYVFDNSEVRIQDSEYQSPSDF